ncbi:MAG: twin-arginine translocation pathway signal protein, partial [Candidatus Aminicenantes bacterium]|nr:twin-arginine translocation pathway signal protein [Candidatus Aminicenantes bacterium]
IEEGDGSFHMIVELGRINSEAESNPEAYAGFRFGARGQFDEYRDTAVRGKGWDAGLTVEGGLFIAESLNCEESQVIFPLQKELKNRMQLDLKVNPVDDSYNAVLSAINPENGEVLGEVSRTGLDEESVCGGLGLVVHFPQSRDYPTSAESKPSFWFSGWQIKGSKVAFHKERAFGPILFAQYTLNECILNLTAQMPPLGKEDHSTVKFQTQDAKGSWKTLTEQNIDEISYTAHFTIPYWNNTVDTPYRLLYPLIETKDRTRDHTWEGVIRKAPFDKEEVVLAAFTGNNDLGFPNTDVTDSVLAHNPDLLFFSGDQIYEGVGGRGVQREPVEKAAIGYLGKWFEWGWAYQDLIRERPCICIPDDHDVYHGNIWGAGGKACSQKGTEQERQDSGGYKMPAWWVNMVQRTQASHLPAAYDPEPVKQGIEVYYTSLKYAGISFAVVEDRKFKSAPKALLPEADIINGWPQNPEFDPKKEADAPDAQLLGERQLNFLEEWASDWSSGVWMKVLLSQSLFANVATLPEDALSDGVVPRLRILPQGEYAEKDRIVNDLDSNGWPQTGRNRAIKTIRKGFALHVCGDQHLGSTVWYGADDWRDSGFALCVPSVSNVWPRRWFPPHPGKNREPDSPKYTGDFEDGFGNKLTVYAVSNPTFTGKEPSALYDRATGFGLVRFNRKTRDITIECWPRLGDPNVPENKPYPGWPVKFNQRDNYGRQALAYLPTYVVEGLQNPVFQVLKDKTGDVVYTLRIKGNEFTPKVFETGLYTVKIGEPGTEQMKVFRSVLSDDKEEVSEVEVIFD